LPSLYSRNSYNSRSYFSRKCRRRKRRIRRQQPSSLCHSKVLTYSPPRFFVSRPILPQQLLHHSLLPVSLPLPRPSHLVTIGADIFLPIPYYLTSWLTASGTTELTYPLFFPCHSFTNQIMQTPSLTDPVLVSRLTSYLVRVQRYCTPLHQQILFLWIDPNPFHQGNSLRSLTRLILSDNTS
jgi:hypothetical protein